MTLQAQNAHIAILTQQVSNYHAARYRAVCGVFDRLTVVSAVNSADFVEFMAPDSATTHEVLQICHGEADYAASISNGSMWERVTTALDANRPDIVAVAGWSFPESLAAIAWAKAYGRPVVLMSASQAEDSGRMVWREWVKGRVVKACSAGLVGGESHKAYAVELGLPPERIFVGYDAVDNAHFEAGADAARANAAEVRKTADLPPRYLLACARFIEKKNFPRLVKAFAIALGVNNTEHDLVILGDGPERSVIEASIRECGLSGRVHLPGFRDYRTLPGQYGLADGFLHVSLSEQWGLVINEAAAAGLPLVVSQPCGAAAPLVQPGRNGWIVDPRNVPEMASAIGAMMALQPEQRRAMAAESRKIVADWGPDRFAGGLVKAVEAAFVTKRQDLSLLDHVLFRALARLRINRVS